MSAVAGLDCLDILPWRGLNSATAGREYCRGGTGAFEYESGPGAPVCLNIVPSCIWLRAWVLCHHGSALKYSVFALRCGLDWCDIGLS